MPKSDILQVPVDRPAGPAQFELVLPWDLAGDQPKASAALTSGLRGQRVAEMVQLGLEYAPQPPFNSGRPDTAPVEVLEAVNVRTGTSAR